LLVNLSSVGLEDWEWKPVGGQRTIREIVSHVGACKFVYENWAFGDASMSWLGPRVDRPLFTDPRFAGEVTQTWVEETVKWLREGHRVLRDRLAELSDDDLGVPRKTNWGEVQSTRWIFAVMIEHDLYHAGEINHLRALRQGTDRWPWAE
jgi:DinB superfamily